MNRQLVISESCKISIPSIDFEVDPPGRSGGYLTTVEGLLERFMEGLLFILDSSEQSEARVKIENTLNCIREFKSGKTFTLFLDDPSGNSFAESVHIEGDSNIKIVKYRRTAEQQRFLGLAESAEAGLNEELDESLFAFRDDCPSCGCKCDTVMHPIDIPHFKEVIIMATVCDKCGYKSNEVKSGGAINPMGKRTVLSIETIEDLSRDLLKAESCELYIPELDLRLGTGTLGGRFTTIEGLLDQLKEELADKVPFCIGDSAEDGKRLKLNELLASIQSIIDGDLKCSLILDDPLGNSYVQNLYAPDADPQISETEYERTYEQNEEFGLNDIKTENY